MELTDNALLLKYPRVCQVSSIRVTLILPIDAFTVIVIIYLAIIQIYFKLVILASFYTICLNFDTFGHGLIMFVVKISFFLFDLYDLIFSVLNLLFLDMRSWYHFNLVIPIALIQILIFKVAHHVKICQMRFLIGLKWSYLPL